MKDDVWDNLIREDEDLNKWIAEDEDGIDKTIWIPEDREWVEAHMCSPSHEIYEAFEATMDQLQSLLRQRREAIHALLDAILMYDAPAVRILDRRPNLIKAMREISQNEVDMESFGRLNVFLETLLRNHGGE